MNLTEESKTSQLARTLIPKGKIDSNKKYIDVSKYYIALYKLKRRGRNNTNNEYIFDIFKSFSNTELGTYYKSINNKLIGFNKSNNMNLKGIKDKFNCLILSANKFDSIRLLMYNSGLIKAYVPGKATEEEIKEVISKLGYLYKTGVDYMFDDLSVEKGKRGRG